jgi:hypothetical protein
LPAGSPRLLQQCARLLSGEPRAGAPMSTSRYKRSSPCTFRSMLPGQAMAGERRCASQATADTVRRSAACGRWIRRRRGAHRGRMA